MALPTLFKTWQFSVNTQQAAQGSALACNRLAWRTMKNKLKAFASSPWTVVASSNASTTSSSDLWAADSNLVWLAEGSAHSWIVLQQSGLASTFQVLIDLGVTSPTANAVNMYMSPGGLFTPLNSITNRPVATDEIPITINTGSNSSPCGNQNLAVVLHAMQSTDGEVTRMFATNVHVHWYVEISKVNNPISGWTTPYVSLQGNRGGTLPQASGCLTYADLITTVEGGTCRKYGKHSATTFFPALTHEGLGTVNAPSTLTVANEMDGYWGMWPVGLVSTTTGARGHLGTLFDLWWGQTTRVIGDGYPADGSKQFIHIGNIIVPWNGTSIVLT